VNTHEISAGAAKFTFTATREGIKANLFAGFYRFHIRTDLHHYTGAVSPQDVGHRYGHSSGAKARPYVNVVERRGFQLDNDFVRPRYRRFRRVFIAQLIAPPVFMYANGLQSRLPLKNLEILTNKLSLPAVSNAVRRGVGMRRLCGLDKIGTERTAILQVHQVLNS
jgi:hypothetical protein